MDLVRICIAPRHDETRGAEELWFVDLVSTKAADRTYQGTQGLYCSQSQLRTTVHRHFVT
jgi:hypothetical protein